MHVSRPSFEIAQQSGISVNAAVSSFFDDLENHFYDYVWLKKRVAELKAEKTKLCTTDSLIFMKEMLRDFLLSSSTKSQPNATQTKFQIKEDAGQEQGPNPQPSNTFTTTETDKGVAKSMIDRNSKGAEPPPVARSRIETARSTKTDEKPFQLFMYGMESLESTSSALHSLDDQQIEENSSPFLEKMKYNGNLRDFLGYLYQKYEVSSQDPVFCKPNKEFPGTADQSHQI